MRNEQGTRRGRCLPRRWSGPWRHWRGCPGSAQPSSGWANPIFRGVHAARRSRQVIWNGRPGLPNHQWGASRSALRQTI